MSYASPRFLTLVIALFVLAPASLFAQREIVKRELPDLASPFARERAQAVVRLSRIKGDIAGDLRVAYKFAHTQERIGLLQVVQLRNEDALVNQAAAALSADDSRLNGQAREYMLALPFDKMRAEVSELTEDQAAAWREFQAFRIRRDIAAVLLDAHLKPGKFLTQFDVLRKFDTERLDRELLAVMRSDPAYAEALNLASREATSGDTPGELSFQAPWRELVAAAGAFEPALAYQHDMVATDAVDKGVEAVGKRAYAAALDVLVDVRTSAVRALADSRPTPQLKAALNGLYDKLNKQVPAPGLSRVIDLDQVRVEIELTLARFGQPDLLNARIAGLRAQIERVQQLKANVNMQAASRPDLVAQNEIAHLKLRAGDLKGAEKEWSDAVENAREMLHGVRGRNRTSLSTYLAAVYYNLACSQSLQGEVTNSLASLKEAVFHGYKDFGWMLEDGDLYQVRQVTAFHDWFMDTAPPSMADRLRDRD